MKNNNHDLHTNTSGVVVKTINVTDNNKQYNLLTRRSFKQIARSGPASRFRTL